MPYRSSIKASKYRAQIVKRSKPAAARFDRNRQMSRAAAATTTVVPTGGNPIVPGVKRVKMTYSDIIQLTAGGVGLGVTYSFRANSIFDPDFTGVGHQPMGRDEMEPFYNHYRVLNSTISMNIAGGASAVEPVVAWAALTAASTTTPDAATMIERGRAAWKVVSHTGDHVGKPLINSFDSKAFFGKKAADSDQQKAAMTANPAEDVYFNIGFQPMDGASAARTFFANVVITYDVELSEPRMLTQS